MRPTRGSSSMILASSPAFRALLVDHELLRSHQLLELLVGGVVESTTTSPLGPQHIASLLDHKRAGLREFQRSSSAKAIINDPRCARARQCDDAGHDSKAP